MTAREVDLDLRRALRREVERLAAEHPELTGDSARERCAEWLADEPPDDTEEQVPHVADELTGDEHDTGEERKPSETEAHAQRRGERPASRRDRDL